MGCAIGVEAPPANPLACTGGGRVRECCATRPTPSVVRTASPETPSVRLYLDAFAQDGAFQIEVGQGVQTHDIQTVDDRRVFKRL